MAGGNYLYHNGVQIVISDCDRDFVRDLLKSAEIANDHLGIRVEFDNKIMHLGAAILSHKPNEVIRHRDGDWFNCRRGNLKRVNLAKKNKLKLGSL